MRTAAGLAAATALLSGCAGLLGPSPEQVRVGLDGFRALEDERRTLLAAWPEEEFADARLDKVGDCGALGAYFICDGTFVLPDGSTKEADLWLHHLEGRWRLTSIVPKDTPL